MPRYLALFVVMLSYLVQGAQSAEEAPVRIGSENPDSVSLSNKSGKAIIGYVLSITYKSPMRPKPLISAKKVLSLTPLADNSTWIEYKNLLSDPSFSSTTTVDYVLFADNSGWGPDTEKASGEIRGMRAGVNMERARLQHVSKEKGVQAVSAAIANPF